MIHQKISVGNNTGNTGLAIFLAIQYGQNGQYCGNMHPNSQYNTGILKSWQYNTGLASIIPHTAEDISSVGGI